MPPTKLQTHNQPEPGDGDPRGATCPAGTAYPARGDEGGLWSLWQHLPMDGASV